MGISNMTRTKLGKPQGEEGLRNKGPCGVGKLYLSARTTSYWRSIDKIKWSKDKITVPGMPEMAEVSEGLSWQMR